MTRDESLACLKAALPDLRARFGVVRLGLFGSLARDEARADSDADLVADFAPDAKAGLFELFALERHLSQLLGRTANIAAPSRMNRLVRACVDREFISAG